jgi:predicted AAA+ superfamily ATPase
LEYAGNSLDKLNSLWLRGGFPESLLAQSGKDSMQWRFDFTKTYMERDIPQLGPRIPAEMLERFWTMLAHNQGSV